MEGWRGNDSVCQISSARAAHGWRDKHPSASPKGAGLVYALPSSGFGSSERTTQLSLQFHLTRLKLSLPSEQGNTHIPKSALWASGLYVLWDVCGLVRSKEMRRARSLPNTGPFHTESKSSKQTTPSKTTVNTSPQICGPHHMWYLWVIGDNLRKPQVSRHATLTLQTPPPRSAVCFKLNSWPFQQLSPESRQPHHHLKSVDQRSRARNVLPPFPKGTGVRERFLPSFPSGFSNKREKNKWKWKVYN